MMYISRDSFREALGLNPLALLNIPCTLASNSGYASPSKTLITALPPLPSSSGSRSSKARHNRTDR